MPGAPRLRVSASAASTGHAQNYGRAPVAVQREFLRHARARLGGRGARLVDAHGDLRAEPVCLRPPAVIDCLEFDRQLRRLDPHEDLALLALEIEARRPALAQALRLAGASS